MREGDVGVEVEVERGLRREKKGQGREEGRERRREDRLDELTSESSFFEAPSVARRRKEGRSLVPGHLRGEPFKIHVQQTKNSLEKMSS